MVVHNAVDSISDADYSFRFYFSVHLSTRHTLPSFSLMFPTCCIGADILVYLPVIFLKHFAVYEDNSDK